MFFCELCSTFRISIHVDMNPTLEIDEVNAALWLIQNLMVVFNTILNQIVPHENY